MEDARPITGLEASRVGDGLLSLRARGRRCDIRRSARAMLTRCRPLPARYLHLVGGII